MAVEQTVEGKKVRYIRSSEGRAIAVYIPADCDEYPAHPTADEWPLQVFLLKGSPGLRVKPHYHALRGDFVTDTRHQIIVCRRGALRVGIFGIDGEYVTDVVLHAGDIILLAEGHGVEYLQPETLVTEIKQGPFPGTDEADRTELDVRWPRS